MVEMRIREVYDPAQLEAVGAGVTTRVRGITEAYKDIPEQLQSLHRDGLSYEALGNMLGVARITVYRWANRQRVCNNHTISPSINALYHTVEEAKASGRFRMVHIRELLRSGNLADNVRIPKVLKS